MNVSILKGQITYVSRINSAVRLRVGDKITLHDSDDKKFDECDESDVIMIHYYGRTKYETTIVDGNYDIVNINTHQDGTTPLTIKFERRGDEVDVFINRDPKIVRQCNVANVKKISVHY